MTADQPIDQPAYFVVPLAPPRRTTVMDRAEGLWAELPIGGEVLEPVHIGSGVPELVDGQLVSGLTVEPAPGPGEPGGPDEHDGRGEHAIIPGSSVKGALRAVFEAITYSCDPLGEERCRAVDQTCPACALFGLPGLRAALAISDLQVEGGLGVERFPQRYSHPDAPRRGRRLYGLTPEHSVAEADEAVQVIVRGARLAGTLTLFGAEPWAIGALALAAGLVAAGLPLLRLGGGKNRGLGAIHLEAATGRYALGRGSGCAAATHRSPSRSWLAGLRTLAHPAPFASTSSNGSADGTGRSRALMTRREATLSPAPPLPAERRDLLLGDARRLSGRHLDSQACKLAAVALVILRRRGVDGLRDALTRDLPAGGTAVPWSRFRRVMAVYVDKGSWQTPAELAFLLGWLKRLGSIGPVP